MGLSEGRKEEGEVKRKEGEEGGVLLAGYGGGNREGGDVQETDGQNELGNEMGGEAGKGGVSWNG